LTLLPLAGGCPPAPEKVSPLDAGSPLADPRMATADSPSAIASAAAEATVTADPVAVVSGQPIALKDLQRPVMEAYGLQFLLHLAQLELARQKAAQAGLSVGPEDVARERHITLDTWFRSAVDADAVNLEGQKKEEWLRNEYERLLPQFLESQRITMAEFDLAMRAGAYLRKLAEHQTRGKITEEALREAFRIEYGEKVRVRHIQLSNLQEVAEARRRLSSGEPFEKVAAEMSRDERSRRNGGEIRPFSRAERMWPAAFVETAFSLKNPGDISEPVNSGDALHLIRLEERIPPNRAVRFEDHRDILYQKLSNIMVAMRIRQLREELAAEAPRVLQINDPLLRRQFQERLQRARGEAPADPQHLRRVIRQDHPYPATAPAEGHREVARPPATMPGR